MNNEAHAMFTVSPTEMSHREFLRNFAGIYEHSPWVAQELWTQGVDSELDHIGDFHSKMMEIVNNKCHNQIMELIKAHPDLAGKAAKRGELTAESTDEQSSAGLDQCSAEELKRFNLLNDQYKAKFEFPFIMAVRHSNRYAILEAFEERLKNTPEDEFQRALDEIHKIALFRLQEI